MFLPAMDTRCATSSQVVCMKRTRCTTSSQVDFMKRRKYTITSHQVVLKDEDLLTLILLRLPYVELGSLKSVSKQWRSLITTPHFTRLLGNSIPPLRASALFIQRRLYRRYADEVYFVSLDNNPNTPSPRTLTFAHDPFNFDPKKIRIKLSCNGLLLCFYARPKKLPKYCVYSPSTKCYVYNPSTNHLETLQSPPGSGRLVSNAGLAFDPSKSIHYKVIAFDIIRSDSLSPFVANFYIYSSETGTWKTSVVESCSLPPLANIAGGVYWNGCIHWLSEELNSESELESTVSDCFRFNVDDERLERFPRPPTAGVRSASRRRRSLYFGESDGHLHFIEACTYATSLCVYEMKSDYSEWFLKYQIDLDPISKVFRKMTKHKALFRDKKDYAVAVLSLIRRENFREDPFLVLEIPGKVIRYNLVTGSVKIVWDFSRNPSLKNIDALTFGHFQVWQYIVSV